MQLIQLKKKRKLDKEQNPNIEQLNLTKQQLIIARKFFLELQEEKKESEGESTFESGPQLTLKIGKR